HLPTALCHPPTSPPSPYTTLFRSVSGRDCRFHRTADRWPHPGGLYRRVTLPAAGRCDRHAEYKTARKRNGGRRQWHGTCRYRYRSEEHTSELQSRENIVCRLLLEK